MERNKKTLVNDILNRGTEDVFVREHLKRALLSRKRLRIKLGIDPTSPSIHLGNAVPLWKLRRFQELGHTVIAIIGDFTAQIGDPSDKLGRRPLLSREQIAQNMRRYKKLLSKILLPERTEFVKNSSWFRKMHLSEFILLAEQLSVGQLSARRTFRERMQRGDEISLREFLYPLLQGYDSVAVRADVEVGGFDQLFNLRVGRIIQRHYGLPEQDIITVSMLEGTDGRKMSKSWGNVVNIDDPPQEMFGKIMSLKDELIPKYFLLCTDTPQSEIDAYEHAMHTGSANPRDIKLILAERITALYHGTTRAKRAKAEFLEVFSHRGFSKTTPVILVARGVLMRDVAREHKLVSSHSEFTRKVREGAVRFIVPDGTQLVVQDYKARVERDGMLRIGKKFIRLRVV